MQGSRLAPFSVLLSRRYNSDQHCGAQGSLSLGDHCLRGSTGPFIGRIHQNL